MDEKVKRYYQLKQTQKEIEQELSGLREEIISHFACQDASELEFGRYKVKLVVQERKEFDDQKLYQALPDPEVWRMISTADSKKVASLLKLRVIPETAIQDTYIVRMVPRLQISKL